MTGPTDGGSGRPAIRGVHHVGILVRDARAVAARLSAALGLEVTHWEEYGPGLLRVGFIPLGGVLLELIEPLADEGAPARWLRDHGDGIQHVALQVDDLQAAVVALAARGVGFQDASPRPGAGGTLIAFLAPEATGGLLVELVQATRGSDRAVP